MRHAIDSLLVEVFQEISSAAQANKQYSYRSKLKDYACVRYRVDRQERAFAVLISRGGCGTQVRTAGSAEWRSCRADHST